MKKFLCAIMLIIVMIIPMNVSAAGKKPSGNLVTEYSVKDDSLKVKKVIELNFEYETNYLQGIIELNDEKDKFVIDNVIIEDSNGEKEIKSYTDNKEEYYEVGKKLNDNILTIHLKEKSKVKKISIEYSYKKVISHFQEYSFSYIDVQVSNLFMELKLDSQKIKMDNKVKGCWINKGYSNFTENDDYKEIVIDKESYGRNIIMVLDKESEFLSYEKTTFEKPDMKRIRKDSTYTKLFEEVNKKSIGDKIAEFIGTVVMLGVGALLFVVFIKRSKRKTSKSKFDHVIYAGNENSNTESKANSYSSYTDNYTDYTESYTDYAENYTEKQEDSNEPFKMPAYINPAYIGILFNTCKEDIIFTILCELIRKDTLEIKVDDKYRKNSDVYRKYILSLTENDVNLENFEKRFIEAIRDMSENEPINLEELNQLIDNGYFDLVVKEADEDFNEYLRSNLRQDASFDEISKGKNIELDKWVDIKRQMTRLKEEEMKKLTIRELELIHVFSTAVALRDKQFSLFKMFNTAELRMSKYFTEIRQTFDNGESVIAYLEKTFIR